MLTNFQILALLGSTDAQGVSQTTIVEVNGPDGFDSGFVCNSWVLKGKLCLYQWCGIVSLTSHKQLAFPFSLKYNYSTTTSVLQLSGCCLGLPGCAGTRRDIHPLTPILIINHPLLPSSTMIRDIFPVQFTCLTVFLHNLCPSLLWSTS